MPLPGVASTAASRPPRVVVSLRNMTPAWARVLLEIESTWAEMTTSPLRGFQAKWSWSALQMSVPPPEMVQELFANAAEPWTAGAPISASLQPGGKAAWEARLAVKRASRKTAGGIGRKSKKVKRGEGAGGE